MKMTLLVPPALLALALSVFPATAIAGRNVTATPASSPAPAAAATLPAGADAANAPDGPGGGDRRARILQRIETIRIAKLTEALNLDQATAEKFFPTLQPF